MYGEMNHICHTSAHDGTLPERALPLRLVGLLFMVRLWMLAGFVGLNLIAIAAIQFADMDTQHSVSSIVLLGLAGSTLAWLAWRNVVALVRRADAEPTGAAANDDRAVRVSVEASMPAAR